MMWIKDNQPDIWEQTHKFGHTNTYMVRRLTGQWAIDPSTTSITGLYHTRKNQQTWLAEVLEKAEIPTEKLPALMESPLTRLGLFCLKSPMNWVFRGMPRSCAAAMMRSWQVSRQGSRCRVKPSISPGPVRSSPFVSTVLSARGIITSAAMFCRTDGLRFSCSTPEARPWNGSIRFSVVTCLPMIFYQAFVPQTIEWFLSEGGCKEDSLPVLCALLAGFSLQP